MPLVRFAGLKRTIRGGSLTIHSIPLRRRRAGKSPAVVEFLDAGVRHASVSYRLVVLFAAPCERDTVAGRGPFDRGNCSGIKLRRGAQPGRERAATLHLCDGRVENGRHGQTGCKKKGSPFLAMTADLVVGDEGRGEKGERERHALDITPP